MVSNSFLVPPRPEPKHRLIYQKIECKCGIWLYPVNCLNPADYLHFRDYSKERSEGYGGRILSFLLNDGNTLELQGPWHGNADSMLADTGLDLTDKHYTIGCVFKVRDIDDRCNYIFKDILHQDKEWIIGKYERIKEIAEKYKKDLALKELYYYNESMGGSSCGPVD